jgi:hypothetical protein
LATPDHSSTRGHTTTKTSSSDDLDESDPIHVELEAIALHCQVQELTRLKANIENDFFKRELLRLPGSTYSPTLATLDDKQSDIGTSREAYANFASRQRKDAGMQARNLNRESLFSLKGVPTSIGTLALPTGGALVGEPALQACWSTYILDFVTEASSTANFKRPLGGNLDYFTDHSSKRARTSSPSAACRELEAPIARSSASDNALSRQQPISCCEHFVLCIQVPSSTKSTGCFQQLPRERTKRIGATREGAEGRQLGRRN